MTTRPRESDGDYAVDVSDMSGNFGPLVAIAFSCTSGACPTIYTKEATGGDAPTTVIVQGYAVSPQHAGVDLPDGELLVEIPRSLLEEAARNLI